MRLLLTGVGLTGSIFFIREDSPPAVVEIFIYAPAPKETEGEVMLETDGSRYLCIFDGLGPQGEFKFKQVRDLPKGSKVQDPVRPRRVIETLTWGQDGEAGRA